MTQLITVGKNVARILGHEFPIDSDLSFNKFGSDKRSWNVQSSHEEYAFTPIQDGDVSAETYRTYNKALHKSIAFNHRGKMRKLFDRKEEGVKIIPGHGVFILPSKMQVIKRGQREIQIRVFSGTEFAKNFEGPNYELMVSMASDHYFSNIRTVTDAVNESLWYPVKYNVIKREFNGLELPEGVHVGTTPEGHFRVRYYSVKDGKGSHFGIAKTMADLGLMVIEAADQRHKEQMVQAMYRFVRPSYISLSDYMKTV